VTRVRIPLGVLEPPHLPMLLLGVRGRSPTVRRSTATTAARARHPRQVTDRSAERVRCGAVRRIILLVAAALAVAAVGCSEPEPSSYALVVSTTGGGEVCGQG